MPVVEKTCDQLDGLRAVAVAAGRGAGLLDDVAEGVVALAGGYGAAGVDPSGDVAVAVVGGEVGDGCSAAGGEFLGHDQAADSACALQGLGEIETPRHAAGVGSVFVFQLHVPAVVEKGDLGLDIGYCGGASHFAS